MKLLVDVVSKNGNLLLSVPLRSDGTFDEKEKAILDEFGAWMRVNKESIIGTKLNAQGFNEGTYTRAGSAEIRFAQKGSTLYATALAWPADHKVTIKSLALHSPHYDGKVKSVHLLGYGKVAFHQTEKGLEVDLPEKPCNTIAPVLSIK